jgi:hypothetical protein
VEVPERHRQGGAESRDLGSVQSAVEAGEIRADPAGAHPEDALLGRLGGDEVNDPGVAEVGEDRRPLLEVRSVGAGLGLGDRYPLLAIGRFPPFHKSNTMKHI